MTVADLIAALKELPQDLPVAMWGEGDLYIAVGAEVDDYEAPHVELNNGALFRRAWVLKNYPAASSNAAPNASTSLSPKP